MIEIIIICWQLPVLSKMGDPYVTVIAIGNQTITSDICNPLSSWIKCFNNNYKDNDDYNWKRRNLFRSRFLSPDNFLSLEGNK